MVSQLEPRQDIQLMRLVLRTPICTELNIKPATEIVRDLVSDAEAALAKSRW
jgi:hypothetical protein